MADDLHVRRRVQAEPQALQSQLMTLDEQDAQHGERRRRARTSNPPPAHREAAASR
jgi:hypothetical protein